MKDLRKFEEAAKVLKKKLLYSETKYSDFIEGLAGRENIIGVGTELRIVKGKVTDELCLKVYVRKKLPKEYISDDFFVPSTFEGCHTVVEEIGEFVPLAGHTDCYDPALGGVSISNWGVLPDTGTLGCKVKKNKPGSRDEYILSCNHVIASFNMAPLGTFIMQPSSCDGGKHNFKDPQRHPSPDCAPDSDKCIAELSEVEKVKVASIVGPWGPGVAPFPLPPPKQKDSNDMDAAIAKIFPDSEYANSRAVDESIKGISGAPTGHGEAKMAMTVTKSGRTTGVTQGMIIGTKCDINNVEWHSFISQSAPFKGAPFGKLIITTCFANFRDQILIAPQRGPFAKKGDSGAVILNNKSKEVVGLLTIAGQGKHGFAVANHIQPILTRFKVHIMTV